MIKILKLCAVVLGMMVHIASAQDFSDEKFINDAWQSNTTTIELAKQLLSSADPELKTFAQTMMDEHTKMNTNLIDLAKSKNWKIIETLNPNNQMNLKNFTAAAATDKNSLFKQLMIQGHERMVEKYDDASTQAKDEQLISWVKAQLPVLRMHLKQANELSDDVKESNNSSDKKNTIDSNTVVPKPKLKLRMK